jgi:hypothetical protein
MAYLNVPFLSVDKERDLQSGAGRSASTGPRHRNLGTEGARNSLADLRKYNPAQMRMVQSWPCVAWKCWSLRVLQKIRR